MEDRDLAIKLYADLVAFVQRWGLEHAGGKLAPGVGLSAFSSSLAHIIREIPDEAVRKGSFSGCVALLTEHSDTGLLVTVLDCPRMAADDMLRAAEPAGRA